MRLLIKLSIISGLFIPVLTSAQTQALPLGWSMVGNDTGGGVDPVSVFGNATTPTAISAGVTTVWTWNNALSQWNFFAPSMTAQQLSTYAATKGYGVLSSINKGEGFWVNAKNQFLYDPTGFNSTDAIPIANAGFARHVTNGSLIILDGSASANNNQTIGYQWLLNNKPSGSTATLTGATSVTPSFTADVPGNYVASLTVTEGTKASTPSTVSITATGGRIAITDRRAFAIKSDGTVLAWGSNLNGELGDGTRTERLFPVSVTGLSGVVEISAGSFHTVALESDGTVMTWGTGSLGNGMQTSSLVPQAVVGLTNVVAIAAGNGTTVALNADGTVVAWGSNYSGKLGDGSNTDRLSPVTVPGLSGIVAVATGVTYTVALKSDGTVYTWGDNTYGQLGDGTLTSHPSPSIVPGLTGVVAIAAYNQTAALKADGTVFMWGQNTYGQLGDGTTTNSSNPIKIVGLTGVVSVSTGNTNTVALKANGSVMAWGNWLGLGDGKGQDQYSPVATLNLTKVAAVASGNMCTIVLNSDGTVWIWGMNNGQFGDGTKNNYSTTPGQTSLVL